MIRESFVFYRSFYEAFDGIPDDVFCDVMRALCQYALDGVEPELTGVSRMAWKLIKPQIDANNRRYENGKKGAEHGKKGGRPKKNPIGVLEDNPIGVNKITPNDNVNENENENDNVNDNDNGCGLLSKLSTDDYNRLFNTYANVVELLDIADDSSQGKEIKNPYRYVVAIAENKQWERKSL